MFSYRVAGFLRYGNPDTNWGRKRAQRTAAKSAIIRREMYRFAHRSRSVQKDHDFVKRWDIISIWATKTEFGKNSWRRFYRPRTSENVGGSCAFWATFRLSTTPCGLPHTGPRGTHFGAVGGVERGPFYFIRNGMIVAILHRRYGLCSELFEISPAWNTTPTR